MQVVTPPCSRRKCGARHSLLQFRGFKAAKSETHGLEEEWHCSNCEEVQAGIPPHPTEAFRRSVPGAARIRRSRRNDSLHRTRSEERRVGKEWRSRWAP